MQQNQILKMQQVLIHQKLKKKIDLTDMKELQNHIGKLFSFP